MKKINLEEIYVLSCNVANELAKAGSLQANSEMIAQICMRTAIQQALELAAESAVTKEEEYTIPGTFSMLPFIRTVVDKQSILNVINLVV